MLKLLKNADVYAPTHIGKADLLIAGQKLLKIAPHITGYDALDEVEVFDLDGKIVFPGLIDLHIHITGGGGEQGFSSRVPEISLSELTLNGVTTVVGLLGTDGLTRSLENLLAKCKSLNEEGITCYMTTGSYQYPSQTLTGSVMRDIALIDEIIGVKVAVSDHRGSHLSVHELTRLASEARLGGMVSGKPGLVIMHMGGGRARMDPIFGVLEHSEVPVKNLLPTHTDRNEELLAHGRRFVSMGGVIDLTANDVTAYEESAAKNVVACLKAGVPVEHITLSSDACGSQPRFDEAGNCVGLEYVSPRVLMDELRRIVFTGGIPLETALCVLTSSPAAVLQKQGVKGTLCEGSDADIVVCDAALQITDVFARGRLAVRAGSAVMKGRFER